VFWDLDSVTPRAGTYGTWGGALRAALGELLGVEVELTAVMNEHTFRRTVQARFEGPGDVPASWETVVVRDLKERADVEIRSRLFERVVSTRDQCDRLVVTIVSADNGFAKDMRWSMEQGCAAWVIGTRKGGEAQALRRWERSTLVREVGSGLLLTDGFGTSPGAYNPEEDTVRRVFSRVVLPP